MAGMYKKGINDVLQRSDRSYSHHSLCRLYQRPSNGQAIQPDTDTD